MSNESLLRWLCDKCGDWVATDDHPANRGYVVLPKRPVARPSLQESQEGHIAVHKVSDLLAHGEQYPPAHWEIVHESCDARTEFYGFVVPATWPELVEWMVHLSEKDWLAWTDWRDLMRRVLYWNTPLPSRDGETTLEYVARQKRRT